MHIHKYSLHKACIIIMPLIAYNTTIKAASSSKIKN